MATSRILWATRARKQYVNILAYISSDSLQNAIAFDNDLKEKLNRVSRFPEMCPIDQYKISNDGNYRSLLLFHYRISYVIRKDEIEILRIRHTSMKPKHY